MLALRNYGSNSINNIWRNLWTSSTITEHSHLGIANTHTVSAKSGFDFWLWSMLAVLLIGMVAIAYFNRARLIPAMQTNNGNVVAGNTPVSRKQTIAAIKCNAVKPSDDVFASIMDRVGNAKE